MVDPWSSILGLSKAFFRRATSTAKPRRDCRLQYRESCSALDPQTTDEILDLLVQINKKYNLTIVLITHEMHVIQKICHHVAIMESGRIVEQGDVLTVFSNPQHPVTERFVKQVASKDESIKTVEHLIKKFPKGKVVLLFLLDISEEQFFL